MLKKLFILIFIYFLFCISFVFAEAFRQLEFDNPQQEILYNNLIAELRCVVCQNQSLAESNASLALQMKDYIYNKIRHGDSKEQITSQLINRYGKFILLKPRLDYNTIILWFFPILLLLILFIKYCYFYYARKA